MVRDCEGEMDRLSEKLNAPYEAGSDALFVLHLQSRPSHEWE